MKGPSLGSLCPLQTSKNRLLWERRRGRQSAQIRYYVSPKISTPGTIHGSTHISAQPRTANIACCGIRDKTQFIATCTLNPPQIPTRVDLTMGLLESAHARRVNPVLCGPAASSLVCAVG